MCTGIVSEARDKIPSGLSNKQMVTGFLTRSLVPMDASLDRALKDQISVEHPGTKRIHAQEVRSFVRNSLLLGFHAGSMRRCGFEVADSLTKPYEEGKAIKGSPQIQFEGEESELGALLQNMYLTSRLPGSSSAGAKIDVDSRVFLHN